MILCSSYLVYSVYRARENGGARNQKTWFFQCPPLPPFALLPLFSEVEETKPKLFIGDNSLPSTKHKPNEVDYDCRTKSKDLILSIFHERKYQNRITQHHQRPDNRTHSAVVRVVDFRSTWTKRLYSSDFTMPKIPHETPNPRRLFILSKSNIQQRYGNRAKGRKWRNGEGKSQVPILKWGSSSRLPARHQLPSKSYPSLSVTHRWIYNRNLSSTPSHPAPPPFSWHQIPTHPRQRQRVPMDGMPCKFAVMHFASRMGWVYPWDNFPC